MYSIYTTEGWVLGGINVGENNRYLDLFTKELGLVRGMAQGARKLESKLRYGLQDLSFSKLSLVKGRDVWRIVNAEKLAEFELLLFRIDRLRLVARVFSLIKRLVKGEERDVELFDDVNLFLLFMAQSDLSLEELKSLETVSVYRILHKLGYIPKNKQLDRISVFTNWNIESINLDITTRTVMVRQINDSLLHSHL